MPCKINKQKKWKKYQTGGEAIDNVPALLTEGEYVIKKEAAEKLGYSNLEYMNETGEIPIFDARKRSKNNA